MRLPPPLVLIAPTRSEYATVRAVLAGGRAGRPAEGALRLVQCGVGPARAQALCGWLEGLERVGGLALIGWAGGLQPGLAAGDVVLADLALDLDMDVDAQDRRVPCSLIDLPGAQVGPMLTVARALSTPEAKRAGAACGALAVEMEAYPLAAWAAARGLPFVHARVILDPFDEPLPELDGALDDGGNVQPIGLAGRLLAQPRLALDLLRLGRRVRALSPTLQALAAALVEAAEG